MRRWGPLLVGTLLLAAALPSKAVNESLRQRAEAGEVEAQFKLGTKLLAGRDGTKKNPAEAALWFSRAAEQGHAPSQLNLAVSYEKGRGVEKDDAKAVHWLMQAADRGQPRAMALLAERFLKGRGVPRSPLLAYMWISVAAGKGSLVGQVRAGAMARQLSPEEVNASKRLRQIQRRRIQRLAGREE